MNTQPLHSAHAPQLEPHERTRIHEYAIPSARSYWPRCGTEEEVWDELASHGRVNLSSFAQELDLPTTTLIRAAQRIARANPGVVLEGHMLRRT